MSAPRLRFRLALPIGLILLVVVLGALQYRWLGQVSEAERAQLQRSLNQRAREFADDFDREIGLAYSVMSLDEESVGDGDPYQAMDAHYAIWKGRARYPDLVKALYFSRADNVSSERTLHRLVIGTGTGEDLAWPQSLQPVQRALIRTLPALMPGVRTQLFSLNRSGIVESVPALIIPVAQPATRVASPSVGGKIDSGMVVTFQTPSSAVVIVELDREVLARRMLKELVDKHFPDGDASRYHIAIRGAGPVPLFMRGVTDADTVTTMNADASASFFSTPHMEMAARALAEGKAVQWQFETSTEARTVEGRAMSTRLPAAGGNVSIMVREQTGASVAGPEPFVVATLSGWTIALRHGAGSLDAAVNQARRRNLAISFSILSVLAFGVGIIVANARRAEKLAAQQMDFVATVSHELRTPLAVIRAAAQNLSAGVVEDPGRAKRYGELIESEGRRLTDMVEEVLEFAGLSGQRRALALKAVDPVSLVREVVGASSALIAAAHAEVDLKIGDDVPLVNGDEEALRRALSNLLANALKHGRDGHWVGVSVTRHPVEGRPKGSEEVHVAVSDRGRGIDAEDRARVFEPFYRGRHAVDQQIQGYGLGLSLVQRIAEAHGGRVALSTELGQGATFTLQLPVTADLAGV
ncbi:MAG TPA: HAMP domain-containing sensor histidine kinase [Vicinamibacterales bacterium]|nr:HAMP domain-containing sensor histidine kinase [Vicinamibacterales bacterium]